MLSFYSASTRMVNSERAIQECIEAALGTDNVDCDLVVIHASMGHDHKLLMETAQSLCPSAKVVGSSCCGVIGSEGVSESMKDVAIMAVRGDVNEIAVAHVEEIYSANSFEKTADLAKQIKTQNPNVNMLHFLASGVDIDDQECIRGLESVLGSEVTIFGATSADSMRGVVSYQMADGKCMEHGAWAVGYADPTLAVETQATHGFMAAGEPMVVTKSEQNRIIELDGRPAWEVYTERLALSPDATCGETIPIGALAEVLPDDLAEEYGNKHILRVVTKHKEQEMFYATTIAEGTKLWLTVRDEERIFNDLDRLVEQLKERINGKEIVAVFHADCLARGRFLFNRVMKEELVGKMQYPLVNDKGVIPPWLGMYGFGEFARLGGENAYHNYSTALYAIYRND